MAGEAIQEEKFMKKLWTVALGLGLAAVLAGCGAQGSQTAAQTTAEGGSSQADSSAQAGEVGSESAVQAGGTEGGASGAGREIKYGKSQGPYTELFEAAIVPILEKEGYQLSAVDFSDLLTADIALNQGDIDVNVEQHTAYLENFNANNQGDLTPISPIPTVPAGLYSSTHSSLDEISDGAKIAVPNDASNMARAYLLLQKIGWIKLDAAADVTAVTQDDITENPHKLSFIEMKSLTIPASLQDVDYAVLPGSIVYNAGIDPSTSLAIEDVLPHLVLQVVVKAENKDSAWARAIVEAYHSDEFKQYIKEHNDGLWWIPAELQ